MFRGCVYYSAHKNCVLNKLYVGNKSVHSVGHTIIISGALSTEAHQASLQETTNDEDVHLAVHFNTILHP